MLVTNTRLNGVSPTVFASPGQILSLATADAQIWVQSSCPACGAQLVYGVDTDDQGCFYSGSPGTYPGVTLPGASFTITATIEPGVHEVRVAHIEQTSCANAMAAHALETRPLRYAKTYDAILSTLVGVGDVALGEITWALIRGTLYATAFLVVMVAMGLALSPLTILALPAAVLIGFGFAGAGMAMTTWANSWQDLELMQLAILPLFLFSATFYPVTTYPEPLRTFVEWTPLYQGIDLIRSLTIGDLHPFLLVRIAYLLVMGLVGLAIVNRRFDKLLLK